MLVKALIVFLCCFSALGQMATVMFGVFSDSVKTDYSLPFIFFLFVLMSMVSFILFEVEKKTSHLLDIHTFEEEVKT